MQAFNEISYHDFLQRRATEATNEIQSVNKEYILGINEVEYETYLYDKYKLEPLEIDQASETIDPPTKSIDAVMDAHYRQSYNVEAYHFIVRYNFSGSQILFKVKPSHWTMTSYEIQINSYTDSISFTFKLNKQDPIEFQKTKSDCFRRAFVNLPNINADVEGLNRSMLKLIRATIKSRKEHFSKENDFFAAINIKINQDTQSVFTPPNIKKTIIPKPTVSKTKEFSSEPMMSTEMFNDVLNIINVSGKNMEKKTGLYKGRDEEALRDQFLFVLETRYEGVTATGETFNRSGKTDILLKYAEDGSNLFVAECKFWHGASEFLAAISQLFDRYLTWRDSKAALLLFVTNKDFTNVLGTIKIEVKNHPCFIKEAGDHGESSLSYVFCLPQDKNKHIHFEIMAFHYDK